MKRNFNMMKLKTALSALTIAAALAVITTACSNEELFLEQQPVAKAPVYHFSLPASIGGDADTRVLEFGSDGASITSRFTAEDKIYAFLVRDGVSPIPETAVAYNGKEGAEAAVEPILPTDISGDGMSCTLSGDLKFLATPIAFMSETPPENSPTAPEVGDRILFCYGMSTTSMLGPLYVGCNYGEGTQDGTATGVGAFNIAKATMVVTGVSGNDEDGYSLTLVQEDDDTKSNIHFENIGSMFRQRLTFTPGENPGEGSANPTIWGLKLETAKGSFNDFFFPSLFPIPFPSSDMAALVMSVPGYTPTPVSLIIRNAQGLLDAQGDVYFAALFNEGLSDGDDALTLTATDFDGNVYTATKSAPSTGFKNSKYYYGTTNLVWKEKLVLPCIIDNKTDLRCLPDISKNEFTFDDAADITISGVSEDYTVDLRKGDTVTFDNFTASNSQKFLESGNGTLNVVLTGDNNFTVSDGGQCILSSVTEDLRLSCTGFSATLTVKVKTNLYCGLCGKNYYYDNNDHLNSAEVDVSTQLAAPGFSVIRSACVDGPDEDDSTGPDYYIYTYTVTPVSPTSVIETGRDNYGEANTGIWSNE